MSLKSVLRHYAGNVWREMTLHHQYPNAYRRFAAQTDVKRNKIVFLEVREDHVTDSFALLYEQLRKSGKWDVHTVFIQEGMKGRRQVRENCLKAIPVLADARYIFIDDSCYFFSSLPLRPGTEAIQVWHACGAFKKFGYSVADKKFGSNARELERFPVHKNFTYVTVSSPEVVWAYAQAFHMEKRKKDILPTGISRTDVFYSPVRIRAAHELVSTISGISRGKKIILYAPTFRGKVASAAAPDQLDIRAMKKALGQEYFLLIKQHPFVKHRPPVPSDCTDFAMDVTDQMRIDDLLMVSDIVISDYSSLIFEYSIFERPMIFFAYDLKDYNDWRGFYYAYDQMTPGPIFVKTEQIIDYIQHIEERFDRVQVHNFREKFMSACDGHATEKIIKLLEE